jgi:cytochrome c
MTVSRSPLWIGAAILALSGPLAAEGGDPVAGEETFKARCSDCHDVAASSAAPSVAKPKMGPSLQGLFGRTAGTLPDFAYSDAMKAAGFVWDEAILLEYLVNPKKVVPKNRMPFNGLKRPGEAENIVAYLAQATQ